MTSHEGGNLRVQKYPKAKRILSVYDDEFDDIDPPQNAMKKKQQKKKINLDLDTGLENKIIAPFSVRIANGNVLDVRVFRKLYYLAFSKMNANDSEYRNRLNIDISEVPRLLKAIEAIQDHISSS